MQQGGSRKRKHPSWGLLKLPRKSQLEEFNQPYKWQDFESNSWDRLCERLKQTMSRYRACIINLKKKKRHYTENMEQTLAFSGARTYWHVLPNQCGLEACSEGIWRWLFFHLYNNSHNRVLCFMTTKQCQAKHQAPIRKIQKSFLNRQ